MAKLTDEQKTFIVMSFARYARRQDIMRAVHDTWGIEVTKSQMDLYDPRAARNRVTPARFRKWQPLYDETRDALKANVSQIPVANAEYRLHVLDEMIEEARGKKQYRLVAELLEQAAKEVGGVFTNTREVKAKVDHTHRTEEATEEERRAILADKLRDALASVPSAAGQPTQH